MAAETKKRERLEVRVNAEHKRLIEKAALASGQPVSVFVLGHLVDAARKVLEAEEVRRLSERDQERFLEILDRDTPTPQLQQAAQAFSDRYGR